MNKFISTLRIPAATPILRIGIVSVALVAIVGCGISSAGKKKDDFFTSGSREADQRASQKMAKEEQLSGSGEGSAEKGVEPPNPGGSSTTGATTQAAHVQGKLALYDRLGGEPGLSNIVADFLPRALQDPRVKWQRKGVKHGLLSRNSDSVEWKATPDNIAKLIVLPKLFTDGEESRGFIPRSRL